MSYKTLFAESLRHGASLKDSIKDYLARGEALLKERHLAEKTGAPICASYTALIDELLRALYLFKAESAGVVDPTALVALGGYGRSELNIRSDVDLMLVYAKKITPEIEKLTQDMLYILWDTGLDIGFSIRSVDESIELAKEDIKTRTALLDARLLHGDAGLYNKLSGRIKSKLFSAKDSAEFINAKMEETRLRHDKYGGSVYLLEPNIKEGEGGLRDYHTAVWIVKARFGSEGLNAAAAEGLVTESESAELGASLDHLLWVRNELHFAVKRKTDQMTFDHQERIATVLGYVNTEKILAVEAFMQQYYRHASNVNRLSGLIQSRCLHREEKRSLFWPKKKVRIDKSFHVINDTLQARDEEGFFNDETAGINAFVYSQTFGAEMDQTLRDLVMRYPDYAKEGWRTSADVATAFLKILKGPNVYKTLSEMNRLRFLEAYIPEFGEIACRVQHDLYHIYTVDAHTLFAVRELERLRGEHKTDFSLLSTIFEEVPNPEILTLAVLLHDIGKAHGKGHAERGAEMTPEICRKLRLSEEDSNLVRFLVKNHLILANTAQYRDIHDEKLIIDFARQVGDIERLNLLYLLTFADVRAVGPDVWNQWKGTLFQELYFKALTVLERGSFEPEDVDYRLAAIKEQVITLSAAAGMDKERAIGFFNLMPQRYFLTNSPEAITGHIKIITELGARPYHLSVRQDNYREYTELVVCTHDVHGLFSMITGVMTANAVDILGAQINTLKNGLVLDVLQVTNSVGERITDETKLRKIEGDLASVITGKVKVAALAGRRKESILDKKAKPGVPTHVAIDNEVSDTYTVLDIHAKNRIGLLYDITSAIMELGLYIHIAKIATKGEDAADIFYVKDIFGQKIFYNERLKEIRSAIIKAVDEKG